MPVSFSSGISSSFIWKLSQSSTTWSPKRSSAGSMSSSFHLLLFVANLALFIQWLILIVHFTWSLYQALATYLRLYCLSSGHLSILIVQWFLVHSLDFSSLLSAILSSLFVFLEFVVSAVYLSSLTALSSLYTLCCT